MRMFFMDVSSARRPAAEGVCPRCVTTKRIEFVLRLSEPLAMFADDLFRHQGKTENDERGHDDRVVEMADHGEKIGNEIDRRKEVRNAAAEEDTGEPGSP